MRLLIFFILILLLTGLTVYSEDGGHDKAKSHQWVVEQYLMADTFPDFHKYLSKKAEYGADTPVLGENIKYIKDSTEVIRTYRLLLETDTMVVYAMTVSFLGKTSDMYLYMTFEDGDWKIKQLRTLAMTGFMEIIVDSLETMPTIPDSLVHLYKSCKLVLSSDAELKQFLKDNIEKFERLLSEYQNSELTTHVLAPDMLNAHESDNEQYSAIQKMLLDFPLHLIKIENGYYNCNIGGMLDNQVGYLYIPEGVEVPKMNAARFIYIEHIIGNWYIYKTT